MQYNKINLNALVQEHGERYKKIDSLIQKMGYSLKIRQTEKEFQLIKSFLKSKKKELDIESDYNSSN